MASDAAGLDWILHVDLDHFLSAVEVRRRPELAGLAVIVGGDGDPGRPRQVVATASYEARAFGVRSGMPLAEARRRCPEGVFLPSDRAAYDDASAEVMEVLRSFGAPVEVLGWDEAFLGVHTADPEATAIGIKDRVVQSTALSCAVGIGETKLQAKTATGFAKPGGVARLTRSSWLPTMGGRPVTDLNGVGTRTSARLAELGIHTVAELAAADHRELAVAFGPTIGPNLKLAGMGGRPGPVTGEPRVAKGRSREVTYTRDLTDRSEIDAQITSLAKELTGSVVDDGRRITHVAVKVRTATFFTRTRIGKLPAATTDPSVVVARALEVLDRFPLDRPVRLLGVRVVLDEDG
ncbi:MAG TPA: DNA polymerase IV [Acidimicrobiales bacterium]